MDVVASGAWRHAVHLPGLGVELLEGLTVGGAGVFDSWLLSQRRRLAAATSMLLGDAARSSMAHGDVEAAIDFAVRRLAAAPLDEDAHAQLIRLYRMVGDDVAAQRQYATCNRMLGDELGVLPGPALLSALRGTTTYTSGHGTPGLATTPIHARSVHART